MIVRWPGHIKPGSRTAAPVITMDIHATILAATNLKSHSTNTADGIFVATAGAWSRFEKEFNLFSLSQLRISQGQSNGKRHSVGRSQVTLVL